MYGLVNELHMAGLVPDDEGIIPLPKHHFIPDDRKLDETKPKKRKRKDKEKSTNKHKQTKDLIDGYIPKLPPELAEIDRTIAEQQGFHISMPGVLILNSKSQGGKSHLARYIFWLYHDYFRLGLAVSGSLHQEGNLDFVPEENKRTEYVSADLKALMDMQASIPMEERRLAYFILDDYINDAAMWSDPVFIQAVTQTFHFTIFILISTQYVNKIPPYIREGCFQVGMFKMTTMRSLGAAFESYGQEFETIKEFKAFNNKRLGHHRFLYINKCEATGQAASQEGEELITFLAPPPPLPRFMLWSMSDVSDKKDKNKKRKKRKLTFEQQLAGK